MEPMKQAIEDRELVSLNGMWVTYHKAANTRPKRRGARGAQVGVLFLNGLYATRAGNGDAVMGWACWLAEHGYPSFRVDLPGFGDSEDDPPADWLGYINSGGYGAIVSTLIEELVRRYKLAGVIVAGHCAGAVSAIYGAATSGQCLGIVLMDPCFNMPRVGLPKYRRQLNLWSRQSRIGGALSGIFDLLKQTRRTLNQEKLPANANLKLLRCLREVVRGGVPVLILRAPSRGSAGLKPRTGEFDYLDYILASGGPHARVLVELVERSNHSFSYQQGRAAIPEVMQRWLETTLACISPACSSVVKDNVILMPSAKESETA